MLSDYLAIITSKFGEKTSRMHYGCEPLTFRAPT